MHNCAYYAYRLNIDVSVIVLVKVLRLEIIYYVDYYLTIRNSYQRHVGIFIKVFVFVSNEKSEINYD